MTIRWFFRIVYALFLSLVLLLGIVSGLLYVNQKNLQKSQQIRFESYLRADELRQSSDDLTRFARSYVVTGDPKYEQYYWDILAIRNGSKPRPTHYERIYWDFVAAGVKVSRPDGKAVPLQQLMRELGFTEEEFAKLKEAQSNSDALVKTEDIAMHAMKGLYDDGTGHFTRKGPPDQKMAIRLMFDKAYYREKAKIMRPIDEFFSMLNARTAATMEGYAVKSSTYLKLILCILAALFVMTLASFFIIQYRVSAPIATLEEQTRMVAADLNRLATVAHDISLGDRTQSFAISAPPVGLESRDEIGQLGRTHDYMISQLQVTGDAVASMTSELSENARQLRDAVEAAESANKAKSQFLARMSHELRTPLNAILGYSELLQEEAEDAGQTEFTADLQKIHAAGKHLLALINDILDLARIEAGKVELHLETIDLDNTLRDVATTVQPLLKRNSNQLKTEWSSDIGACQADLTKVRQILLNLLGNASKFTQNGTVSLRAARAREDDRDWVLFKVEDNGIGMTPEQMQNLFKEFSQADTSTTRKYGGTGLGLAISKRFCEMMSGEITLESEIDKGSCFTVRLPAEVVSRTEGRKSGVATGESEAGGPATRPPAGTGAVLVIDDDPAVRDLMKRFLEKEGFPVVTASAGEEGIKLAREIRPRVITLDVIMPEMDGWAVLKALKDDPDLKDIPVIMVSMVDGRDLGYALGVSDYMTKPIEKDRLSALLRRYRCADPPCPVLLVEDDADTREMIGRILRKEGWEVAEAENGRAALDVIRETLPTVILLDLMMPEMDGFEFLTELRKEESWQSIPVVVITAKSLTLEDHRRLNGYVKTIIQKEACSTDSLLRQIRDQVRTLTT